MPGILPMKVIKVGVNAQTRIAQACDRCRSKKIRCDGVRPCCSQCSSVGFECKTSDKLSRRAFPRGYTESLEERVRGLESEVRELKELLDEKDEKIDMLSRIHSQSPHPIRLPKVRRPSTVSTEYQCSRVDTPQKDELFKVQQSPHLLDDDGSDSYFAGTSSGRTFIEAFKHCVQEGGRSTADIHTASLLTTSVAKTSDSQLTAPRPPADFRAPSRMVSDQLINIFFQEWAPLFPVLHRPTFLALYESFTSDCESIIDKTDLAQMNLVLGIAALSGSTRPSADLDSFECQWKSALDCVMTENNMATLQALILAQLFCVQQGDLARLQTYKGLATSLSARLGLHQSQKRFALDTVTCETRKKVFWTLYTVDSFTAVLLGLPKHLKDNDIQCEYPDDVDDEYITERGFQPTLPGESTKISSALALFKASRILSKVLEDIYPAKASYELSLKKLSDLSDGLDAWSSSLPPHLRLSFAQDKPSTGTISSRSPLLSLTYNYIKFLIHRPAVCATLDRATTQSSMMSLASSSKQLIQIIQLLDERGLSFSFCLNKDEVLVLSGFGLLFQGLDLDEGSKILKDNSKMITAAADILNKAQSPCAGEFERVAMSFVPAARPTPSTPSSGHKMKEPILSRSTSDDGQSTSSSSLPSSTKKQLKAIASRFTSNSKMHKLNPADERRATIQNISVQPYGLQCQNQPSLQQANTAILPAPSSRSEPARSPVNMCSRPPSTCISAKSSVPPIRSIATKAKPRPSLGSLPNLDYLSFGNEENTSPSTARHARPIKPEPAPTDWERLLGSIDNGDTNIYDACYGGPPVDALVDAPSLESYHASPTALAEANNNSIDVAWHTDLWALCQPEANGSMNMSVGLAPAHVAGSIMSFSSGDEEWATTDRSGNECGGIVLPVEDVSWDLSLGS